MNIWRLFVQRPVLASVFSLVLLFLGLFGFFNISLELYPSVTRPKLYVYIGAEDGEPISNDRLIAQPMSQSLSSISGIKKITTDANDRGIYLTLEFPSNDILEDMLPSVQDRANRVKLPDYADPPRIFRSGSRSTRVLEYVFPKKASDSEVQQLFDNVILPELKSISGLGETSLEGLQPKQVVVSPNLQATAQRKLLLSQVFQSLDKIVTNSGGGRLISGSQHIGVDTQYAIKSTESIKNIPVTTTPPTLLSDIASISLQGSDEKQFFSFHQQEAGIFTLKLQDQANPVEVARSIRKTLQRLGPSFPSNFKLFEIYNLDELVVNNIQEIEVDILLGILLTFLIVALFLGKTRYTGVVLIAIPISLISSFFVCFLFGISLNVITLMALSLSVGIVIDDAIVVLESIVRHFEQGESSEDASVFGTQEVSFAVLAATLAIIVAFVPLILIPSEIGRLFTPLATVIITTMTVSLFISWTLTPSLTNLTLKTKAESWIAILDQWWHKKTRFFDSWLNTITNRYTNSLELFLNNGKVQKISFFLIVIAFTMSFYFLSQASQETPREYDRRVLEGMVNLASSLSWAEKKAELLKIETILEQQPEIDSVVMLSSPRGAMINALGDFSKVDEDLPKRLGEIPELRSVNHQVHLYWQPIRGLRVSSNDDDGDTFSAILIGADLPTLKQLSIEAEKALTDSELFEEVDFGRSDSQQPQIQLEYDIEKLLRLGLTPPQVAQEVSYFLSPTRLRDLTLGKQVYNWVWRTPEVNRMSLETLKALPVSFIDDKAVLLRDIATPKLTQSPSQIRRLQGQFFKEFSFAPKVKQGEQTTVQQVQQLLEPLLTEAGPGYQFVASDNIAVQQESQRILQLTILGAIILVFLILAGQFESFIQPIIILVCLPLTLIGVALGLFLTHSPLSIFAVLGCIMLIGIVNRNAILLVDFANHYRAQGYSTAESLLAAGKARLRPILMTTLSTSIGILPIALGMSNNGEVRSPLGIVVIFGMLWGTFLTLFIIPAVYQWMYPNTQATVSK